MVALLQSSKDKELLDKIQWRLRKMLKKWKSMCETVWDSRTYILSKKGETDLTEIYKMYRLYKVGRRQIICTAFTCCEGTFYNLNLEKTECARDIIQIVTGIEVNSEVYFPNLRGYCPSAEGTRAIFPQMREINLTIHRWCQSLFVLLYGCFVSHYSA